MAVQNLINVIYKVQYNNKIIKMKIMKAFEIQSNYQRHRQRLKSINKTDTNMKVARNTSQNISFINNFKKLKLTSDIFKERQKTKSITSNNQWMQKTLTKVYTRPRHHQEYFQKTNNSISRSNVKGKLNSKSSMKSISSEKSRILQQNKKLSEKISGTKSQYTKIRQSARKQSHHQGTQHNQQLIRLLQNQLGLKPKVIFPKLKRKKESGPSKKEIKSSSKISLANIDNKNKTNKYITQSKKSISVRSNKKKTATQSVQKLANFKGDNQNMEENDNV